MEVHPERPSGGIEDGQKMIGVPLVQPPMSGALKHRVPQTFAVATSPRDLRSTSWYVAGSCPQSVLAVPSVMQVPQFKSPPQPSEAAPHAVGFVRHPWPSVAAKHELEAAHAGAI